MSNKSDSTPARTLVSSEKSASDEIPTNQDRYYAAWATVGEVVAMILTCAAAKLIGQRIALLAEGGWLPGKADCRTLAALTNRPESSINEITSGNSRHKYHVGRQVFYRLEDFAQPAGEPSAESAPTDAPAMRKKKGR